MSDSRAGSNRAVDIPLAEKLLVDDGNRTPCDSELPRKSARRGQPIPTFKPSHLYRVPKPGRDLLNERSVTPAIDDNGKWQSDNNSLRHHFVRQARHRFPLRRRRIVCDRCYSNEETIEVDVTLDGGARRGSVATAGQSQL